MERPMGRPLGRPMGSSMRLPIGVLSWHGTESFRGTDSFMERSGTVFEDQINYWNGTEWLLIERIIHGTERNVFFPQN